MIHFTASLFCCAVLALSPVKSFGEQNGLPVKMAIEPVSGEEINFEITNTSASPIVYESMTCSWQQSFSVDSDCYEIGGAMCTKNIPNRRRLEPNEPYRGKLSLTYIDHPRCRQPNKVRVKFFPKPLSSAVISNEVIMPRSTKPPSMRADLPPKINKNLDFQVTFDSSPYKMGQTFSLTAILTNNGNTPFVFEAQRCPTKENFSLMGPCVELVPQSCGKSESYTETLPPNGKFERKLTVKLSETCKAEKFSIMVGFKYSRQTVAVSRPIRILFE